MNTRHPTSNLLLNLNVIVFCSWKSKYALEIINLSPLSIENPYLVEFLLISRALYPQFTNLVQFTPCYILALSKFHNEINALKQILKTNEFSIQFSDRCIKQVLQKLYVTNAIHNSVNKKQLLIVFQVLNDFKLGNDYNAV